MISTSFRILLTVNAQNHEEPEHIFDVLIRCFGRKHADACHRRRFCSPHDRIRY